MDTRQVFKEKAVKEEFLDRFDELKEHVLVAAASDGGLEGLDVVEPPTLNKDTAREVAESLAEGTYEGGESGLEAIIERFGRPVFLVQDATFAPPPDDFPNSEVITSQLDAARARLDGAIPSAGRIDVRNHRLDWVGTGWVVGPGLVVTNRHVAREFARESNGGFAFRETYDRRIVEAEVDWRHEYMRRDVSRFDVQEVLWIEPEPSVDVALLRIATAGRSGEPVPAAIELMTQAEIDATQDRAWVAVIGYPAYDSRNNDADQQRIFDRKFNVKRLAPGQLMHADFDLLNHDATTLGGNSGSVVFDLESGKAIGLHFGGVERDRNHAVAASRIQELIDERAS